MLSLKNIVKIYKSGQEKVIALDNINLNFPKKGLIFVTGKSGSGKSTLLNILGGLDTMTSGEILIDGYSTDSFKTSDFDAFRNAYIGFIFQEFHLIDDISVFDNIALSMKVQNKKQEMNSIEDTLKMVGLENYGYRKSNELSGGQRQRIAVARAIIKNPYIILADEPTGNLDSLTGENLIQTFKKISNNRLVIIVTHDKDLAYNYGDRVIELKDGKVISDLIRKKDKQEQNINKLNPELYHIKSSTPISSLEFINENLKNNTTNYLCLNTDKFVLSLAYPDNFDDFYNKNIDLEEYEENNIEENINKKTEKIKLPKSYISTNETFKMALNSFNRKKIRAMLMIFFSLISISLFSFSYKVSNVSAGDIAYHTINKNNIQLAEIKKVPIGSQDNKIYSSDREYLEKNNIYAGYNYINNLTLPLMDFNPKYGFSSFKGIIEIDDFKKLNLKTINNTKKIENINEIIITDYAAKAIVNQTFIGDSNDSMLQIIKVKKIADLIGKRILMSNNQLYLVKDIIITDYKNLSTDLFNNAKELYYEHMFTSTGFTKDFMYHRMVYENGSNFSFKILWYIGLVSNTIDYSGYNQYTGKYLPFLYLKDNQPLKEYDVYISNELLKKLIINSYGNNFASVLDMSNFRLTYYYNSQVVQSSIQFKIRGVYQASTTLPDLYFSQDLMHHAIDQLYSEPTKAYVDPQSIKGLANKIDDMKQLDLYLYFFPNFDYTNIASLIENTQLFLYISLGAAVLGFLFVILFMTGSIKVRKKEIGILRASGAKDKDIFQIFGMEILITTCIITVLSFLTISILLKNAHKNIGALYSIIIAKVNLWDFIILFSLSFIYLALAAIIPILAIVIKKPIESIQKN